MQWLLEADAQAFASAPGRFGSIAPADPDHLAAIEAGTDRVLEEVGLRFEGDPETLSLWRSHGMRVDGEVVYLDGGWLRDVVRRNAPERFVVRARNPERDTLIGAPGQAVLAPIYGAPNVLMPDGTRASGSIGLYRTLVLMAHDSPVLSNTGHMICVPHDIPEVARPMEMVTAHLTGSDKPCMGSVASPRAAEDVIDAAQLAIARPAVSGECELLHLLNATPPLTYKENPLKCLRAVAKRQQALMVTSYMMMGATSPVTVAGTLIQGYAEALAGLALAQLWSRGTPVVMGLFGIPFSMRTMLPIFGDPASQLIQLYVVQLARRLGIPSRGDAGITSANVDDAQAGYEGAKATSTALHSGADFILHAAGWLEQGRCVSFSKFEREAGGIHHRPPLGPPLPLDEAIARELRARAAKSKH